MKNAEFSFAIYFLLSGGRLRWSLYILRYALFLVIIFYLLETKKMKEFSSFFTYPFDFPF